MKAQLKVLCLLLLVLLGIIAYERPAFPAATNDAAPAPDSLAIAAPDSSSQRILFFGDSMIEGLTRRLSAWAEESGDELQTVIWYGSSTETWAKSDTLNYFVRNFRPTYIIACIGSNELFVKDLENRKTYLNHILKKFGQTPNVWICPPAWTEDTGICSLLKETAGNRRFFDSRRLEYQRGKDHRHPTFDSAASWADSIATWLQSDQTAHPLVLSAPSEGKEGNWRSRLTLIASP